MTLVTPGAVVATHTFGAVLRGHELAGLSVEEVMMPRGLSVPEHAHEDGQIYFILEGNYAECSHGSRHLLGPGDAWFRPPRERHENAVVGEQPALALIMTVERLRWSQLERVGSQARTLHSLLLNEARSEILRELRSGDAAAAIALEGWSLLLLSRAQRLLSGERYETPEWIGDAVRFIERRYLQPLALSDVATHVGVHPATLAAAFRRCHSLSVGEYIRELRLQHAREALLHSCAPIKEIALQSGFYDQAHLGRWFRRRFGVSPAIMQAGRSVV
jgi:AraC family transcriptional regulator